LWRNLYGLPIKLVAALLQEASVVVTLENGIGHLAHAVDASTVMIYSNIVPLGWANPVEASCCEVLYDDPSRITADAAIAAAQRLLRRADRARPERAYRVMR
jgi:ADP-heptose:LPS heptosyltransferase